MKTIRQPLAAFAAAALLAVPALFPLNLHAQDGGGELQMTFPVEDSVKKVKVTVLKDGADGAKEAAADVEVNVYAKKSFGLLPLGDAQTTDESGEVVFDFPTDLPGDSLGDVLVVAKVVEDENLGDLETKGTIRWGVPVKLHNTVNKRALWATGRNAPVPLVIMVTSMVAGAWGVIFYIIVLMTKIRKAGDHEPEKA
jgi:hypothetical protein